MQRREGAKERKKGGEQEARFGFRFGLLSSFVRIIRAARFAALSLLSSLSLAAVGES